MGFMAGFGDAFATSFENSRDRRAKREEDEFRMTFDEYTKRRDEKMKYDREDAKYAKQAAGIAQRAGVDDPKAVAWLYDQIKVGTDPDTLLKEIRRPGAKFISTASETAPSTKAKQTELQQQMSGSGLAPDQPTVDTQTPAPEEKGDFWSKLFPGRKSPQARAKELTDANIGRIAQVTGQDPSEVQKIMTGDYQSQNPFPDSGQVTFTPGKEEVKFLDADESRWRRDQETPGSAEWLVYDNMLKAAQKQVEQEELTKADPLHKGLPYIVEDPATGKLKRQIGIRRGDQVVDSNGNPLKVHHQESEEEQRLGLELEKLKPEAEKARAATAATVSLYKQGGELMDIAQANPIVLTSVGDFTQWVDGMSSEAKAAYTILKSAKDLNSPEVKRAFDQLDSALSKYGIDKIAADKSLFDSKLLVMSYRAAAAEGQGGSKTSEKDFTRIHDILSSSNGHADVFARNLADYLGSLQKPEDDARYLPYNQMIEQYKSITGTDYAPQEPVIGTQEALEASQDPAIRKVLSVMNGEAPVADEPETSDNPPKENAEGTVDDQSDEKAQQSAPEGYTYVGKSPDGKNVYADKNGNQIVEDGD